MSTTTGRREDEPIDGPVRQLLWRLRARMVSPPSEQQVSADLDRLIRLARVQAHEAPSADATSSPASGGPAIATPPDHPVVHGPAGVATPDQGSFDGTELPVHDDELAARRSRFGAVHSVTRVAAAAMVLLAFGAGLAGARDGTVTLTTIFGRDAAPDVDPTLALQPPGPATSDDDDTGDDASSDSAEVAEDDGATSSQPADDGQAATQDPGATTPTEDAPAADDEAAPAPEAEAPKPRTSTSPRTDEQIVAAPAPEDLDGFGGPKPCDKPKLEDCLPADETEVPVEDPVVDDVLDEDVLEETERAIDEAEQLAKRRFGGSGS